MKAAPAPGSIPGQCIETNSVHALIMFCFYQLASPGELAALAHLFGQRLRSSLNGSLIQTFNEGVRLLAREAPLHVLKTYEE